mmetsp:Transcript_2422/g.5068  ORF Transcript_2422/g.5068 Transcript_2422/m.5068 type:complete len:203 (-) Transcript_2422:93-701(-)
MTDGPTWICAGLAAGFLPAEAAEVMLSLQNCSSGRHALDVERLATIHRPAKRKLPECTSADEQSVHVALAEAAEPCMEASGCNPHAVHLQRGRETVHQHSADKRRISSWSGIEMEGLGSCMHASICSSSSNHLHSVLKQSRQPPLERRLDRARAAHPSTPASSFVRAQCAVAHRAWRRFIWPSLDHTFTALACMQHTSPLNA